MKTKDLLRALKLASPALHSRDFIPILTHFCFAGDQLYAYDDKTAIVVFSETGLECAVPGKTLLELLEDAGDDVELSLANNSLNIVDGKTELQLPVMPADTFIFEVPTVEADVEFELDGPIVDALDFAAANSNVDTIKNELMGVTVIVDERLRFYSTDDATMTRVLSIPLEGSCRATIPKQSAELIGKIYRDLKDGLDSASVGVAKDYVIVQYVMSDEDDPPVVLICKTIPVSKPAAFESTMAPYIAGKYEKVPTELLPLLKRCAVVGSLDEHPSAQFLSAGANMGVKATGKRGRVDGEVPFAKGFGTVSLHVNPRLVVRALGTCDTFGLHEKCVALRSEDDERTIDYIVSPIVK